jgi:hypothetical protein
MPPRRELTLEEYHDREARQREQARVRMARRRARNRERVTQNGSRNGAADLAGVDANPPGPPIVSLSSLREEEIEEVRAILEPFADRGYRHDRKWWLRLAARCPDVDLYLEASKVAEWLQEPRNSKEACSKARLTRWLKKEQADAEAGRSGSRGTAQPPRPGPAPEPLPFRREPHPAGAESIGALMERVAPEAFGRAMAARPRRSLEQKVAAKLEAVRAGR